MTEIIDQNEVKKSLQDIKLHYLAESLNHYNNLMNTIRSIPVNQSELTHVFYQLQSAMLYLREFINSLVEKPPVNDAAPQENGNDENKPEA